MQQQVFFHHWQTISYTKAWAQQQQMLNETVKIKLYNREAGTKKWIPHHLIYCEHYPVFTLGRSGAMSHLLLNETELLERKIEFYKINRGGDITFHGLGQIVAYPIFDLEEFFTDVHRYVRCLEEVIILTLAEYNLVGIRVPNYTGIWIDADEKNIKKRKICAIGVHLSRWVTMHGLAFNINTDLSYFDHIIPCGIADADKAVTSLQQELGYAVSLEKVTSQLKKYFSQVFDFQYIKND